MESILAGKTGAQANADAEASYKAAWKAGARIVPGSPCEASEAAFKSAYNSGEDSILESALAFVKAWPGVRSGNPCAVSGLAYMEAIVDGKSEDDAGYISAKAFIDATLSTDFEGYDPVCAASALAYMDSFAAGNDALTSNLIAAKAFYQEYAKGTSPGTNSPCVKA